MAERTFDISICYNPDAFPFICMPNSSEAGPITKDDLQFNDFFLQELRSEKFHVENYDPNRFTKTFDKIFEKYDDLIKIRAVLIMFALKNIIDVSTIFGFIITEDKIKTEVTDEEFEKKNFFEENNRYFNDIFYNQLSKHPVLMLDVIETIYSFFEKNSSQYEESYGIINRIILTNEGSLSPVPTNKLNFMEEAHVGKFKNQILRSCPIILPFSMKYKDYLDEDPPEIRVSFSVDRENILNTIWRLDSLSNFSIRFRINFLNEEGTDCGGLTKEFIQLAFDEIFKPETGLFDFRNNYYWFRYHNYENSEQKNEMLKKYFCVGIFLGIVVLNKMTISYHFPPYFYKKLLHRNINQTDLNYFDPQLFRNFINLVSMNLTEESYVDYTFTDGLSKYEIDLTNFRDVTNDSDFAPTPLVDDNKGSYITRIAKWVFDVSIKDEFEAFENGFCKIRRDPMLYHAFRLDELDKIVSGAYQRNWEDLKQSTKFYGFARDSKTIGWFWKYFDELDEDGKLNVLKFITASTSTPPGGLKDIRIEFSCSGNGGLPVAHTCFNRIDFPEYSSYEDLKDKCDLAFAHSDSFTCS